MESVTVDKHSTLKQFFRSPHDLKPLKETSPGDYRTADGAAYPLKDGVFWGIPAEERGEDLGDKKFYEENPFGVRDWSNPEEVTAGVEQELKDVLAKLPKDALIADVGCGSGRVSNYMSLQGFTNVMSIDYSLNSVKMVEENSNNCCVWGNAMALPLQDNAFDLVICTGVIHHTPHPEKVFAECCRITKPGGLFFMKTRNVHSPYGYLFKTYGAVLRFSERTKGFGWISDIFGFGIYKFTRTVFYRHLPKRPNPELRGKYENLFIKDLITFFTTPQIKKMLKDNNMEIQYGWKTQFTHRQHFYVSKKLATGA